jgi:hypothetical protein
MKTPSLTYNDCGDNYPKDTTNGRRSDLNSYANPHLFYSFLPATLLIPTPIIKVIK